jgi:hypothetical protein
MYEHSFLIFRADILLDITATNGLKFSMLTLLNSSKKRNFNKEVATKFKDILSKGTRTSDDSLQIQRT